MKTAAEPSFQSAFSMRYRMLSAVLFLAPGAVPLILYALKLWTNARMIDEVLFGTTDTDLGWIASAGYQVGGLWDETWGNGPLADPNGDGLVLSPIGWGWCVLGATLVAGVTISTLVFRLPGVIPFRSALSASSIESADHELRFAAARALIARRILVIWGFVAPTCALLLALWFVNADGGEALGNAARVLLATVAAALVTFALSVFAGARWTRRDVLRVCGACIACGYSRPAVVHRASKPVCSECGWRHDDHVPRRLSQALYVCIVLTCWVAPWLVLGWIAFTPRQSAWAWIPYDSPRVIHLDSGRDLVVVVNRLGTTDLPAPDARSFDVRIFVALRCTQQREAWLDQQEMVVHFSGNHVISDATGWPELTFHAADAPPDQPGSILRVRFYSATDHCVHVYSNEYHVGISDVTDHEVGDIQ